MNEPLERQRCVPCEGGVDPLTDLQIAALLPHVPLWTRRDDTITRCLLFVDFVSLMRFVNRVADLAEDEGHHPDFSIHWNKLDLVLWTHAIGGLHENDFVVARKIDLLDEDFRATGAA